MNTKTIARLTGTLTLLLALFSFILSFNALADLAAQHNISIPYLFPLVVEAGVIIFSLNALYRSLHGEHAKWQWVLIIGSSLIAGSFNVLHANADFVSRVMAAMPSLFLLLSFESFINQMKHGAERAKVIKSIDQLHSDFAQQQAELDTLLQTKQSEVDALTVQIEQATATLQQLQSDIEQAHHIQPNTPAQARQKKDQDAQAIEQRRTNLLDILHSEGDIGATAFANRLNISRGTVYSDLKALHKSGVIAKNGQGWEVVQ